MLSWGLLLWRRRTNFFLFFSFSCLTCESHLFPRAILYKSFLPLFFFLFFSEKKTFNYIEVLFRACHWMITSSNVTAKIFPFSKEMLKRRRKESKIIETLCSIVLYDDSLFDLFIQKAWEETHITSSSRTNCQRDINRQKYHISSSVIVCSNDAVVVELFYILFHWVISRIKHYILERETLHSHSLHSYSLVTHSVLVSLGIERLQSDRSVQETHGGIIIMKYTERQATFSKWDAWYSHDAA